MHACVIAHGSLIATPNSPNAEAIDTYVTAAGQWLDSVRKSGRFLLVSESLIYQLSADRRFPFLQIAQHMLDSIGVKHLTGVDIARVFERLWDTAHHLEPNTRIERMEVDPDDMSITWTPTPDPHDSNWDTQFSIDVLAAEISDMHGHSERRFDGAAVASSSPNKGDIEVTAQNCKPSCECDSTDQWRVQTRWFSSPLELLAATDPVEFREMPELAVESILISENYGIAVRPWKFHRRLIVDLADLPDDEFRYALGAVARAIIIDPGAAHQPGHPLREGLGPGTPQQRRQTDGAKARRIPVTKHQTGLQLHYWQVPDNSMEFASVRPHGNFNIPK